MLVKFRFEILSDCGENCKKNLRRILSLSHLYSTVLCLQTNITSQMLP